MNGSWKTALGLFLGQLAVQGYKSYKQPRRELLDDYRDIAEVEIANHAEEIAEYEKYVGSLPALAGDGNFDFDLDLSYADLEMLDHFTIFMEANNQKGSSVFATLTTDSQPGNFGKIRVEISQAFISTIVGSSGQQLCDLAQSNGGAFSCSAKIEKRWGQFEVKLDLAWPPKIASKSA